MADKLAEDRDRAQRQLSLSQTAMLNRTSSLSRRNRDVSVAGGSSVGGSSCAKQCVASKVP